MVELKHGAHECVLTSPEMVADGICNICFKDEPVAFACDLCNFDLCRSCSKLPLKVSHDFHTEHPLELRVGKQDGETRHMLCSGCGNLFSGTFYYKCNECEIYLDLSCSMLNNIEKSWDAEEKLHYSHAHLLRRCRPGPGARGSCLLCELPLTPSAICYGCVQCYSFVHERCLDLPREIQHPVHRAHPLRRLDFTHTCGGGKECDACGLHIDGAPLGCAGCNFSIHMRCADSLLRGLMHRSHEHRLFYVATNARTEFRKGGSCHICRIAYVFSSSSYYHCVECDLRFHFECLEIPEFVVKKSYHIHPLFCKTFLTQDNSMEYCGVCETMIHARHRVYSCKECDFVGHLECILQEETPSPLYLKDLYTSGEDATRPPLDREDNETNKPKNKIMVNHSGQHNHVLRFGYFTSSGTRRACGICHEGLLGRSWMCATCQFRAHDSCVKMTQPSMYRFHLSHPLTLVPSFPAGVIVKCDTCKEEISSFNLFCRICNFIICAKCMVRAKKSLGELQRGQKFIRYEEGKCLRGGHTLVQVMVSRSYPVACTICNDRLSGNTVSCMECKEIYHSLCIERGRLELTGHPLHPHHKLEMKHTRGSKCIACKLDITMYGFFCRMCSVSFHLKCIEAVDTECIKAVDLSDLSECIEICDLSDLSPFLL